MAQIHPRMLPKAHVTTVLLVHECTRLKDFAHCSLWKTASGFHFTVPREGAHELTDEATLAMIVKEIGHYGALADAGPAATD